jgi:hypothetical protein
MVVETMTIKFYFNNIIIPLLIQTKKTAVNLCSKSDHSPNSGDREDCPSGVIPGTNSRRKIPRLYLLVCKRDNRYYKQCKSREWYGLY